MGKLCVIVGAGETGETKIKVPAGALVIAADGGVRTLEALGISPDIILGDFDSLGHVPEGDNVIVVPSEKDDTDTMLAVKKALSLGADAIVIYGGTGGRFDHTVANLQTLKYIAQNGARGYLAGDGYISTAVMDGGIGFDRDFSGYVSAFCLGDRALGVCEKGLKYTLENAVLTDGFPLGASNEFTGEESEISVGSGCLLVVWAADSFDEKRYRIF